MNRFEGKTALVTAAGQGIERAIVERLLAGGAQIIATGATNQHGPLIPSGP